MSTSLELIQKIEETRKELDVAILQKGGFEHCYEVSTKLDRLIEAYLDREEQADT